MTSRFNGSVIIACIIFTVVAVYMLTGDFIKGGKVDPNEKTIAELNTERASKAFKVRTVKVSKASQERELSIRGRTKASTIVPLRAETDGTLLARTIDKGDPIKAGDVICELDTSTRASVVTQAEANLRQAEFDLASSQKLLEKGFSTEAQINRLKTGRDAAKASFEQAQKELSRTQIRATVSGIAQDPIAEVGDNLSKGSVCATLVQLDPMTLTAQIGERNIFDVKKGQAANVKLISGQEFQGEVSYIASTSDPRTRTFNVEINIPNPDGAILDGITAAGTIALENSEAYLLNPNWLVLHDDGRVGVRVVDEEKTVDFRAVQILSQTKQGIWAAGLDDGLEVITLGQDFVTKGQIVETATQEVTSTPSGSSSQSDKET